MTPSDADSADADAALAATAATPAALTGLDTLARHAIALMVPGQRVLLGITGSPGAGKTTLAISLAARVVELLAAEAAEAGRAGDAADAGEAGGQAHRGTAVHLPMDGYHLANATLDRLGTHDRKGAIDTFDGWGFVALLNRLRVELDHTVYAPSFDRSVDEGVAGEIAVTPDARLVIVEGNYLLVDQSPWSSVAGLLAESWFCETNDEERLRRLVARHERHGRSPEAAEAWASTVDGANAILIEASRPRATIVVSGVDASIIRSAG
ncbi:nucleoside/nucleotide kinase family protein [Subtercola frigoramans]|uniref:Pantothenate kinase n=1 Tax=Subtercola frigoramans TaxID=120298 RepID=A0ABS2L2Z0_9MICO|nr:nucleoside/nucleotide kinase family protein [Subtercola frigoramans]MBM7470851.1 pantothenate kinase [Subtercola frigoramans]